MAGPDSYAVKTQQRQAGGELPGLSQIKSAGPAARPATVAPNGSISYIGAQTPQLNVAEQYNQAEGAKTAQFIMKIAGEYAEPYIQDLQKNMMIRGMQEVAAGRTLDEIRAEQPWYSKIFGDSDVVTAAEAYHAQAKVDDWNVKVQQMMPDLARLDADQFRERLLETWNAGQEDNHIGNLVANQQFLNAVPGISQQYQKMRIAHLQTEAAQAQREANVSKGGVFHQKFLSNMQGMASLDDVNKTGGEFIMGLQRVDGQTDESYAASLVDTYQGLANNGSFSAIAQMEKSGILNVLDPNKRFALQQYAKGQEELHQQTVLASPDYLNMMNQLSFQLKTGQSTVPDILAQVQMINNKAKAEYGYNNPIIDPQQQARLVASNTDLLAQEAVQNFNATRQAEIKRRQKIGDLEGAAALQNRALQQAQTTLLTGGRVSSPSEWEDIQSVGSATFDMMNQSTPDSGYQMLVRTYNMNDGKTLQQVKARFNTLANEASNQEYTPEFEAQVIQPFNKLNSMQGGRSAAYAYFGDYAPKIDQYNRLVASGMNQGVAYHRAFVQPGRMGDAHNLSSTDYKAITGAVDSETGLFNNLSSNHNVTSFLSRAAASRYSDFKANQTYDNNDDAAEAAVKATLNDPNFAFYKSWAWDRQPNSPTLETQLGIENKDSVESVIRATLAQKPEMKDVDLNDLTVIEQYDPRRGSNLIFYGKKGDSPRITIVPIDDLRTSVQAIRREQQKERMSVAGQADQTMNTMDQRALQGK